MRLANLSAAVLLLASPFALVAQGASYPVRTITSIVDTLSTFGLAEPASGRFIVYVNGAGIHIIDQRTGKETSTINRTTAPVVGSYMAGSLSISASGRRLVFLAAGESNDVVHVWSVDLDTLTGKPVSPPHRVSIMPARGLAISDDGRWIAIAATDRSEAGAPAKGKLLIMPSDGGEERVLDTAPNIQTPRWSPDGKTIYYIRGRGHGPALARIAAAGGEPDSLTRGMSVIGVSADGQRIAYYPYTGDNRMIVRFADPDGREIRTIAVNDFFMAWSRHEPGTMFGRRGQWLTAFKSISLDDGKPTSYSLNDSLASAPRFSADGTRLAVTSTVDNRAQIIVYDPTSNQRRVLRTTAEPLSWAPDGPSMQWSPDGKHIAFLALDSSFMRHEIYAVDVATLESVRLADLGPARWSNATLFRWRSDGQSIDYITGTTERGAAPSLERVTLSGKHSVITKLPAALQGNATDGGFRLLNDSLVAIGRNPRNDGDSAYLAIVDARTGTVRTTINRGAYWDLSNNSSVVSPDGKWIAFGSRARNDNQSYFEWAIASLDGKTVRTLGEPMSKSCPGSTFYGQAWPHEWLSDSRSMIAVGHSACASRLQVYVVSIDGTAARHIPVPSDWDPDVTLIPGKRSLLLAAITSGSMNIVAVDLTKTLATRTASTGKARKTGQN